MTDSEKVQVLVADDEESIRRLAIRHLAGMYGNRIDVHQASNGAAAEERIIKGDITLALMDVKMPGKSGLEVIAACQGKFQTNYVVMSGIAEDYDVAARAAKLGVNDILPKPFTKDSFTPIIAKYISLDTAQNPNA